MPLRQSQPSANRQSPDILPSPPPMLALLIRMVGCRCQHCRPTVLTSSKTCRNKPHLSHCITNSSSSSSFLSGRRQQQPWLDHQQRPLPPVHRCLLDHFPTQDPQILQIMRAQKVHSTYNFCFLNSHLTSSAGSGQVDRHLHSFFRLCTRSITLLDRQIDWLITFV